MLCLSHFSPLVGESFQVQESEQIVHGAQLIEARRLEGPSFQGREPFALLFRGPPEPLLRQSTYRLHHQAFHDLEMFLVPVGRTGSGVQYEAIFN